MEIVPRKKPLQALIDRRGNGLVKVITGIRRCGKSFLLFTLFKKYLMEEEHVPEEQFIEIQLDDPENAALRDPMMLWKTLIERIKALPYAYVFIDEIQFCRTIQNSPAPDDTIGFYEVLNGLLHRHNVDVYVTGSNSKMLTTDVLTQFRGRGDEIHLTPLTFAEYFPIAKQQKFFLAFQDYMRYGGLPILLACKSNEDRKHVLKRLAREVYLKDLVARYHLRNPETVYTLLQVLASSVGSYVNPLNISNTFSSVEKVSYSAPTIRQHITFFEEAYLLRRANQFDIKGRKIIGSNAKFYFEDLGLRNAVLNFDQIEDEPHLMENLIYNELLYRGYDVNVGRIESRNADDTRTRLEVDFVARKGNVQCYVQSAWLMPSMDKIRQEHRPLEAIPDNFQKVIITPDYFGDRLDPLGIRTISLEDFLLKPDCGI